MDTGFGQENKIPASGKDAAATSLLNQFILGQLKEKQGSSGEVASPNGFVLPKLQMGNSKAGNFVIPPLKLSQTTNTTVCNVKLSSLIISQTPKNDEKIIDGIGEISNGVNNLQVNDSRTEKNVEQSNHAIDLTAALSTVTGIIVQNKKTVSPPAEDFHIPFIECDRKEKPILLPVINNYFQPSRDISTAHKKLATPSSCGRIICLKYKRTHPFPEISHVFKVKHKIHRFHFDTKSPDDIVLATLNKYHRQY
ncbi:uncharacterized protein LOC120774913 isoform X1 [Bactrocera tryoni]|uniref:uncharacterized protein LOC120774913 isoform X1 n=1 Tax=Bactrocera tryoni TaxID=59916 RepID=UPI001A994096|nr:uncharacterized protein LOC120774913 isoform X1 [Bactrocera tryoni]